MASTKKALAAPGQVRSLVAKLKSVTDPGDAFQIANALDSLEGLMKKFWPLCDRQASARQ